jgi:hypothetical protein
MKTINQLIYDAQAITRAHHDGLGHHMIQEAGDIRKGVLGWAGFKGDMVSDKTWISYIPMMPQEVQKVMVALDDALDSHDTTRYM